VDEQLSEMAGRAQAAKLHALFQVIRGVALPESTPTSDSWRKLPTELPEFLDLCVKESEAASAEAFVLGPHLGPIAVKNPVLVPATDLAELSEWFGFYGRAFRLRQFLDESHPHATLVKTSAVLIKEVAAFVTWRLRAYGVKKPY
jgi:hypothetical protein